MAMTETIDVRTTTRTEMIDITALVRAAVRGSGVDSGVAVVFCKHTTAGVTIQENSDPKVRASVLEHLAKIAPHAGEVSAATNVDAHVKSSIIGGSLSLVVDGGKPVLGPWQAIYFCEFDGPRSRQVLIKVVG